MDAECIVVSDPDALAHKAAEHWTHLAQEAVTSRGRFSVVLSGGSTPAGLYRLLAQSPYREQTPWHAVHLFWGDERCVPPDDPASNFRLAEEALISQVRIPPENIHRILGEREPDAAARSYIQEIEDYFCGPRARFDLVLLGLGSDGHTASLFPGSEALRESRMVVPMRARYEDRPTCRVTLTLLPINAARHVLFLVSGETKAEILKTAIEEPEARLPAQQVNPQAGQLIWLVDKAAASRLQDRSLRGSGGGLTRAVGDFRQGDENER
jgi:6-phosphogluconolactonase